MRSFLIPTMLVSAALGAAAVGAQEQAATQEPRAVQTGKLPLTRLVLFSSGVGYFQHDGIVVGDARRELSFSTEQINDLLKSLVLRDLDGGSVRSVTYASRDPVERTLKSFPIDLTQNPSLAGLLHQIRGEEITVVGPERIAGRVIGVEQRTAVHEGTETGSWSLNLMTADGIRSVPLDSIQGFRLARAELQAELTEALMLLASSKDLDRKAVALEFSGQGSRRVSVGYIVQTPVWKTSYRLVLGEDKTHFLQGWAIVENTTEEDWKEVKLSLVSGRPVSFIMDLYEPLYVTRPTVELELYSSLKPRTYEMAMDKGADGYGGLEAEPADMPASVTTASAKPQATPGAVSGGTARRDAPSEPLSGKGVVSAASAAEVGDLFQYSIDKPVTLPRQQSALLPIVDQDITAERYSIYNESVHTKFPLNGLKLSNTTGLDLMQGPITVFDGGVYAGDAQIANLPAGSDALLSYSIDLETEVAPTSSSAPEELTSLRITKGILVASYKYRKEKTYAIKNRSSKDRTVMIEHPLDTSWTLTAPKEPTEKTRAFYRFAVPVAAGKSASLTVTEQRQADSAYSVSSLADDRILLYVRTRQASAALKAALEKVTALRLVYQQAVAERQRLEARVQEIGKDQGRIRENMDRLEKDSTLYNRYLATMTEQEDELEALATQIAAAKELETSRKKELESYISTLDVS